MDKDIKEPTVTVMMPVYNGANYLKEAIESILNQTFSDFEFLIIDDGSTDQSSLIIASYNDKRIRLVKNGKNLGLIASLNKGISLSEGKYIARMDADDVSLKQRLQKQVDFMETHSQVIVCGTFYKVLIKNRKVMHSFPISNDEIKCWFLFGSPIPHPSVIIRRDILKMHNLKYSKEYTLAEDYDFWCRISEFGELANMPKPLLYYRVHKDQVTVNEKYFEEKRRNVTKIRIRNLNKLGIYPTGEEIETHNLVSDAKRPFSKEAVYLIEKWLLKIREANELSGVNDEKFMDKVIIERWMRVCIRYSFGITGVKLFLRSDLYKVIQLDGDKKRELLRSFLFASRRKLSRRQRMH